MPPWTQIRFQYEKLGRSLDDLANEFGISAPEIQYAAESWQAPAGPASSTANSGDVVEQAMAALIPKYFAVESLLLHKIQEVLSDVHRDTPGVHTVIKTLTECLRLLKPVNQESNSGGNMNITVINHFDEGDNSSYSNRRDIQKARNVTTPEAVLIN